ncbi:hypothetical protein AB4Z54_44080, partial [Streptomyces sp. MCAF7]
MSKGKPGKFDGLSHSQLYALVQGAEPDKLTNVSYALITAFTDLNGVADEMLAHADNVKWKGQGSEAFRTWVEDMSKQTRKLADYTLLVGVKMADAGSGLAQVKSAIPKPDSDAAKLAPLCYADEEKEKARLKNEPNRQEAIRQIEKLDSHYMTAHTDIAALGKQEPNFPTLPSELIRKDGREGGETPLGTASVATASGYGSAARPASLSAADRTVAGPKAAPIHPAEVSPH